MVDSVKQEAPKDVVGSSTAQAGEKRIVCFVNGVRFEIPDSMKQEGPKDAAGGGTAQAGKDCTVDLGDGVTLDMVWIEPGTFTMGSPSSDPGRYDDEVKHNVTLTQGFWLGKYEVTNAQFGVFADSTGYQTDAEREGTGFAVDSSGNWETQRGVSWRNPGWAIEGNQPVVLVSWNDAQTFIEWLNEKAGSGFHLPTEAEWEYACRGGSSSAYPWGDDPDQGVGCCNALDQTLRRTYSLWKGFNWDDGYLFVASVGSFKPNRFGLYDMVGNVYEWCQDWYGDYPAHAVIDPMGPDSDSSRVVRGGAWFSGPWQCRSASRHSENPSYRHVDKGFRAGRSVPAR
ncbi:MAG TPA: formylglycine-generating enzyme family protein [Candidatus Hydrogenedentes bacterium]|nr:formylglycine-generating enzyme family protein [Candidatus Hydrogenedentota bacterium]